MSFFFLHAPPGWVLAGVALLLLTVGIPLLGFHWTTRPSRRYPAAPPAFDYKAVRDRTRRGPSPVRQQLKVAEELRKAS